MILELYSIKDELSEFSVPFPAIDDANAKRYFRNEVKKNQMMADNPQDFSIWNIGKFDTETGKLEMQNMPYPILVERARVKDNGSIENKTVQNDSGSAGIDYNAGWE